MESHNLTTQESVEEIAKKMVPTLRKALIRPLDYQDGENDGYVAFSSVRGFMTAAIAILPSNMGENVISDAINKAFPNNRFDHRKGFEVEESDETVIKRLAGILRKANPDGIISTNEALAQIGLKAVSVFAKEPAPLIS